MADDQDSVRAKLYPVDESFNQGTQKKEQPDEKKDSYDPSARVVKRDLNNDIHDEEDHVERGQRLGRSECVVHATLRPAGSRKKVDQVRPRTHAFGVHIRAPRAAISSIAT
jgi:hypothetical protein